ncbi:MAG: CapA family protein, partial [Synergistaceae bacterium]|nr:CapA family protein [Synergistaceae bacterium]
SGIGEPLVVGYEGFKIAILSFTYGSNTPPTQNASADVFLSVISKEAVTEALSRAKTENADLVVACFHWGNEYQFAPTKGSREIAELCFENGADMVIGTHPHVLQPLEIVSADRTGKSPRLVAWSLGNFVSNQRTLPRERSVVLAVDVEKKSSGEAGGAKITKAAIAPTWVSSRRIGGRRRFEVVYAGTGTRFNHEGLPRDELNRARAAGARVLEFLGAKGGPDAEGFYTLWDAKSPDVLPVGTRKSPE